jgi:enterochelin esterase-like enzyme
MSNVTHYYQRTIEKSYVPSTHLAEGGREVRVFLPPGYQELISYPVIYCQDGEQFFNFGRIATQATKLILDEAMEPMIIVGIDVDVKYRTEEYSPEGDRFRALFVYYAGASALDRVELFGTEGYK